MIRTTPQLQSTRSNMILPGATLGILGGGQLGRMTAIAARQLGYRVRVLTPTPASPAGAVADDEFVASLSDLDAARRFVESVDAITFETENVPFATLEYCAQRVPSHPHSELLATSQDRILEKTRLAARGFPVGRFWTIVNEGEMQLAALEASFPAIVKTAAGGYDGKGQQRVATAAELPAAWQQLTAAKAAATDLPGDTASRRAILEEQIDFECELSVVVARNAAGDYRAYGPFENEHSQHILDVTVCPARIAPHVATEALRIARDLAADFGLVGVCCIEFFLTRDQRLLINEIAPRPHNSGHLTLDAHVTSQFEQQVRAVCGLPLGDCRLRRPAAMANLLGQLWLPGTPPWHRLLANPQIKLHLYGKEHAAAGRKMGHLTVCAKNVHLAERQVRSARKLLTRRTVDG